MKTPNLPTIRALRPAWNTGRIVGQKRPLKPKHVWAIRVRLELAENHRDLPLFNLAIDSKLRGCDLMKMEVIDVMASDQVKERATCGQSSCCWATPRWTALSDTLALNLKMRWLYRRSYRNLNDWAVFTDGPRLPFIQSCAAALQLPRNGHSGIR